MMSLLSFSRAPCFCFFKPPFVQSPNKTPTAAAASSSLSSINLNLITWASKVNSVMLAAAAAAASSSSSWQPPSYVYPDPIPEFAIAETEKFRVELRNKLSNSNAAFGHDNIDSVVDVCAEILSDFLHKEYGGPGTLVVEPFTDMLLALKEKKLPAAAEGARAALLWAQNYLDQDWVVWNNNPSSGLSSS